MGDSWMKLPKEKTKKLREVIEDGYKHREESNEFCSLCCKTNCDLFGLYGTDNSYGSFKGVCRECLGRLNELSKN